MDIELRHLRVVCAIAEAGSVTKAATQLGLAQPALTAQLKRIERSLGGELFARGRRGVRPTALGELVLARARLLLPAVTGLREDAVRLVGNAATGNGFGRCRLGATNGPVVGGLVHRLTTAHPQAHVSTHTTWSQEELAEMVLADRLDFALIGVCGEAPPPEPHGLTWRTVCVDAVCVLMSDQHPLAGRDEVELIELAGEQWANAPGDGCFNECFAAACARAGFTPRHLFETDVSGCVDLLVAGQAVVLCQGTFRDLDGVAMVHIAGTPLSWRHLLGWRPGGEAAGVAEEVLASAVAAYGDTVDRRPRYGSWLRRHPQFGAVAQAVVPWANDR